jgi:leucyl aminopeptidase (aminopeptidase T)
VAGIALPRGVGADLEATAKTLVNQAAGVKAGDRVLISGTPRDIELLENIAINVQKLGAFPIITIESERLTKRSYDDVPANFDAQTNDFGLKLAGIANVTIGVDSTENEGLLANVPPARRAARAKANQAVMQAFLKNNVRQVSLGNGLFPTEATAKRYGLAQDELSKSFWDAVNVDYSKLQYTGDSVRSILAAGKEIQVTNPNGTDIKFRIESRPVLVSDGVISKDDVAKGGAACQVWLPAGEVYATPVPGTAEGKIVVDRHYFQGKEITGLTLTFKGGKLTEMTAKSGLEPLKALYDASAAGKDELGFFDIGINPALKATADTKLRTWVPAGMVSIGIGGNTWAGGTNDCPFDVPCFLPGSTLKVDGKALIENGTLKP